jgi:hypothetical protein
VGLVEQIHAICSALDDTDVPWALGGAIALAYATEEPRGTRDVDINVFVDVTRASEVFGALPDGVEYAESDIAAAERDGQVRLWWAGTPIDIFFARSPFHGDVDRRCRRVPFGDRYVRVLGPEDLAVFKAMFDRPKDWVDIANMAESATLDAHVAADRLATLLGDDRRVDRLREIGA